MINHKSIVPMSVLRMIITLAIVVSAMTIAALKLKANEISEEFSKTDLMYISYL